MKSSANALTPSDVTAIVDGSDNVFADLELPNAPERLSKALLARAIRHIVTRRSWTQAKAAKRVGLAASDMSDVMRGKLARFSLDRLESVLLELDMDIHIVIRPVSTDGHRGRVTVELLGID